jgi:FkbM family methyltransferase
MNSMIKGSLTKWLGRVGVYHRAKASWIYDWYWRMVDKKIIDDRQREIDFYRSLLNGFCEGDLIFDIGANQGYKTGIFLRLGARVISLEPDETSQEILEQSFLKYRVKRRPLTIVPKAVSDKNSIERMWVDKPGSAKNTLSQKWVETLKTDDSRFGEKLDFGQWKEVETVSIETLINEYGSPFFIKIDVEGHEPSVLRGMQRAVPYLSFEVNLPEFESEGLQCVQTLARLEHNGRFNYATDCRYGFALKGWLQAEEFSSVLRSCREKSIEVFWKTGASCI